MKKKKTKGAATRGRPPVRGATAATRIEVRATVEELAVIDQAAAAMNETRSDFIRHAAMERAAKVQHNLE